MGVSEKFPMDWVPTNAYERGWNAGCRALNNVWAEHGRALDKRGKVGWEIAAEAMTNVGKSAAEKAIGQVGFPADARGAARLMKKNNIMGFIVEVPTETRELSIVRYPACPLYDDPNEVSDDLCVAFGAFERTLAAHITSLLGGAGALKVEWTKERDKCGKFLYCQWCFKLEEGYKRHDIAPTHYQSSTSELEFTGTSSGFDVTYRGKKRSFKRSELILPKGIESLGPVAVKPYLAGAMVEHELIEKGVDPKEAQESAKTHTYLCSLNWLTSQEQAQWNALRRTI